MFAFLPSRRIPLSWLLLATAGLLIGTIAQAAAPDAAQHAAFRQAYVAARQGGDGWQMLAPDCATIRCIRICRRRRWSTTSSKSTAPRWSRI